MINEILFMNGYGMYVWSSFIFTLSCFGILYLVVKTNLVKEQKKFESKFNALTTEKVHLAKKQDIFKEILVTSSASKI